MCWVGVVLLKATSSVCPTLCSSPAPSSAALQLPPPTLPTLTFGKHICSIHVCFGMGPFVSSPALCHRFFILLLLLFPFSLRKLWLRCDLRFKKWFREVVLGEKGCEEYREARRMGAAVTTSLPQPPVLAPPSLQPSPSILSTKSEGLKNCVLGGCGLEALVSRLWVRDAKVGGCDFATRVMT